MKLKIGIVLLVIQAISTYGTITGGGFGSMDIAELIGFLLPAFIGIVLIISELLKKK